MIDRLLLFNAVEFAARILGVIDKVTFVNSITCWRF